MTAKTKVLEILSTSITEITKAKNLCSENAEITKYEPWLQALENLGADMIHDIENDVTL